MVQRDLIAEQRLADIVGDDPELRALSVQLIAHAGINHKVKAYWVCKVLDISPQLVASHRECGDFRAVNVGSGYRPRYRYDILSIVSWYKRNRV